MNDELKITKDRVLAAAEKCGTAKEILKELFPEAFRNEWELVPVEDLRPEYVTSSFGPTSGGSSFIRINHSEGMGVIIIRPDGTWRNNGATIKIENGRVWRKRGD